MRRTVPGIAIAALALLALVARERAAAPDTAPAPVAAPRAEDARVRARLFWQRYREGTRHRTEGELAEAASAYESALALDADHEDALYYLGNVRLELGQYPEAERAWRRLVAANPRSDRGHARLGELHLCLPDDARRDPESAETEFRQALHINREQTGPMLRLGQVALLRDRRAEAKEHFDAVLGTNATSGPAHYYAGYLAWKEGDARGAARHYEQALATPEAAKGSNEGDTKNAPPPTPLQDRACPAFDAHLAGVGASTSRAAMEASYRRLDADLARMRAETRRAGE
jgi:tetratricopeptide (TPR) repeat protein